MRHMKRFKQLNELSPQRDIGYITGRAKSGCSSELKSAKELHSLLRDYTYHLIGLGNTFRDIARTFGEFHGSNWRTYRGMPTERLKAIASKLNKMDPYDTNSIIAIERELEALAESLKAVSNE